jgi:hypothetical protein
LVLIVIIFGLNAVVMIDFAQLNDSADQRQFQVPVDCVIICYNRGAPASGQNKEEQGYQMV